MIQQIREWRMQQLFNEVVNQFQSSNQYDKFVKEASKQYDIKIYHLHQFSLERACHVYNELYQKYQDKVLPRMPCGWHENQRRVYVWFIVCYIHYKLLDPIKLVDGQKHWKHISHTFWDKDVNFLKYQLHTTLKTRGRTTWKALQDELLKKIYPKHPKGQWNQVAKEFFFQSEGKCFKTPKQCRERWLNHLNENIKKGQWTAHEDQILLEEVKKNKKQWARIIPLLNNARTQHMIKNRFKALLNKAMQDKNVTEEEAIDAILVKKAYQLAPHSNKSSRSLVQLKKHQINKIQDREIQFVQSEQIISESVQPKKAVEPQEKRKRGRPKNAQSNPGENLKAKIQPIRPDVNMAKNSHLRKIGEIEGCQMIGPETLRFQNYIFRSDSFSGAQSNSFFKINMPNGLYDSAYSLNSFKFPCDDRSFNSLQQFALKQERNGKFESKKSEDNNMREIQSIRMRPNESFISKFMNP